MSRPEEVENAAGTRHAVCLSPAPGGVEFVMSPQFTSCQVGWRESSAGGFRHAELALRKPAPGAPGGCGVCAAMQTWARPEPGSARPHPESASPPQGRRGPDSGSRPIPAGPAPGRAHEIVG